MYIEKDSLLIEIIAKNILEIIKRLDHIELTLENDDDILRFLAEIFTPPKEMVNTDANPQKNGMIDVPGKSNTGIADDVPMDLPEGSFVINAAAVEFAGLTDIEQMIKKAEEEEGRLINQGTLKQTDQGGKTPVLVSNREVTIRPNIAKIIGLDKLEKINNRGKAETERAIQEEQLAEGNPQPERVQSPKGRMT